MDIRFFALIFAFSAMSLFAQNDNEQNNVAITIYNQGIGVVNETRSLNVPKGLSEINITDIPTSIIPTSVHFNFDGDVYEQNYRYDLVSMAKLLEKYIDKKITVVKGNETESGTLLSIQSNNLIIKTQNGLKVFPDFNQYQITVDELPSGLLTKPTLVWKVFSNKEGKQDIALSYNVSNISWNAKYVGVLNDAETQMDINSWVSIDNSSGGNYENATLKLIAGDVNIALQGVASDYTIESIRPLSTAAKQQKPEFEEEKFFEYHIYELNQPATILNNETKQLSLFNVSKVNVQKKYKCYQTYSRNSDDKNNVDITISFKNEKENGMGIPLPAGSVSLFKTRNKTAELIGEDFIEHTPKDEEVELKIGKAFDILYTDVLALSSKKGERTFLDQYLLEFFNHSDKDVEIEVNRWAPGDWSISDANFPYTKKDAHNIIFKVMVPANKTAQLKYSILYTY